MILTDHGGATQAAAARAEGVSVSGMKSPEQKPRRSREVSATEFRPKTGWKPRKTPCAYRMHRSE